MPDHPELRPVSNPGDVRKNFVTKDPTPEPAGSNGVLMLVRARPMTISKLTKGILNVYLLALIAATMIAGMSNAVAKSTYWIAGGEATSQSADGEPEFSVGDVFHAERDSH